MSKLLRTSVVALTLIAGASSAIAQEYEEPVPDESYEYDGYPADNQERARQFWQQFEDRG